jgi:hypothetical protein
VQGIAFDSAKAGVRAGFMLRAERTKAVPTLMKRTLPQWPQGLPRQPLEEYKKHNVVIALTHGDLHQICPVTGAPFCTSPAIVRARDVPRLKTVLLNGLGRTLEEMCIHDGDSLNAGDHIALVLEILASDMLPALDTLNLIAPSWHGRFRFPEVTLPQLSYLKITFGGGVFASGMKLPKLSKLHLSGLDHVAMDFTVSVNTLASLMLRGGLPSLHWLYIERCGLGDAACHTLASALSACPRLQHVSLRRNNIGLVVAQALWQRVPQRKFKLDFAKNDLLQDHPQAREAIRSALVANPQLTIENL